MLHIHICICYLSIVLKYSGNVKLRRMSSDVIKCEKRFGGCYNVDDLLTSSTSSPPLPPGPFSLPVVGYVPFLGPDMHKQFTNMARTYGPIFKMVSMNITEIFGRPNMSDFFPNLAWFDMQGVERDMEKQLKMMDRIIESMIEDRIKSKSEKLQDGVGDREGKKDFLQILLDLKSQEDGTSLDITHIKALLMVRHYARGNRNDNDTNGMGNGGDYAKS
ncbi:hypothetical protein L1987_54018 [Smallanthus sonchifolius]|uniref:Uncharacterized protein n=1 Tax=Smallanthus sonchifolius TaxID=185202 RepID=A0ACB9E5I1_9ASTR|nr:hypothetical protein L1987_54018 [Smallanthus sonchifolius]